MAGPTQSPGPAHPFPKIREKDGNHTLIDDNSFMRPTTFLKSKNQLE